MDTELTRLGRQMAIWRALAAREHPLLELARRFGVSKNTIQREIDALSASGARIRERREGQRIIYSCEGTASGVAALTASELAALDAARASLAAYTGTPLPLALDTAAGKLGASLDSRVFRSAEPVGPRIDAKLFASLVRAIFGNQFCKIEYTPRGVKVAKFYEVQPYQFYMHQGVLYLRARVPPHVRLTTFVAHRLSGAEITGQRFTRERVRETGFGVYEEKPERVRIRFAPEVADVIAERTWHSSQRLTWRKDGSVDLEARVSGMYEVIGWVLSWSPWAELLAPTKWRREIRKRASATAAMHG